MTDITHKAQTIHYLALSRKSLPTPPYSLRNPFGWFQAYPETAMSVPMKILDSGVYQTAESIRVPEGAKNADSLALFPELVTHQVCDFNKQLGKLCCGWATDNVVKNTALPDDSGVPEEPVGHFCSTSGRKHKALTEAPADGGCGTPPRRACAAGRRGSVPPRAFAPSRMKCGWWYRLLTRVITNQVEGADKSQF